MLEEELGTKNKLLAAEISFCSASLMPSSLAESSATQRWSHIPTTIRDKTDKGLAGGSGSKMEECLNSVRDSEQPGKGVSWAFCRSAGIKVVLMPAASPLLSTGFSPLPSHLNHLLSVICFYIQRFVNNSFPQGNSKFPQ